MDTITLIDPLDMHVHFRQGAMLNKVVPLTAGMFSGALAMPNTNPPVTSYADLVRYYEEVACAGGVYFRPYMTLFLRTDWGKEVLPLCAPLLTAVKLYPRGMTTNSHHGVVLNDPELPFVLLQLEDLGIPLCVHAEAEGFCLDREQLFHEHLLRWSRSYPRLKIVVEHITDARTIELLSACPNVYATVTPHHLLTTLDDVVGDRLNPHLFCKPIPKRPDDRDALRALVFGPHGRWGDTARSKIMLGTDSAPHPFDQKEAACGCAGVFTAPIALQLLAEEFFKNKAEEYFQHFVSDNAKRIYGLDVPKSLHKVVCLKREPFRIPERYATNVVPMWANVEIPWSVHYVA